MRSEPWYCLFRGEAGPMAVSAESVAEVIETERLVRLAWSPPQVVGLCPYHREVVPVVRLAPAPRRVGADPSSGPDPSAGAERSWEKAEVDDRTRCILLILKTDHGAWGIPGDSVWTIQSRESPEFHRPRTDGYGRVLIGTIPHAETRYGILDVESTWHGLRLAISRWYGLISEPELSSPIASGVEPRAATLTPTCPERSGPDERCRGGQ